MYVQRDYTFSSGFVNILKISPKPQVHIIGKGLIFTNIKGFHAFTRKKTTNYINK